MNIVKLVIAFIFSISSWITPYAHIFLNGGVDNLFEEWSEEQEYTADYAVELQKTPGKDFKVLNIADVQLSANEVYGDYGAIAEDTLKRTIEEVKPDLITLSGDNSWCDSGYIRLVEYIDSFGVPWAPVMGNHDGNNGNKLKEAWDSCLFLKAKNCVFKFGPKDMGFGNYVINITENGKIVHTLFMMDTHSGASDTEAGKINIAPDGTSGYDHLWQNQIDWYRWAVNGTTALNNGQTVESSVIFHIPVNEYRAAMAAACNVVYDEKGFVTSGTIKEEYADNAFGSNDEWVCSPEGNNGFFTIAKELGSTKNMIAGHEHVNNLSVEYEGIRLTYSLKCGPGCYWDPQKNGGTVLTIDSDGHGTVSHHFVTPMTVEDK